MGSTVRIEELAPRIEYSAPPSVRDVIARLGRTEDVRFSPAHRRLAVAAFTENRIAIFDIAIESSRTGRQIALSNVVEFSSSHLDDPHGLDFVGEDQILVTNRNGRVCLFDIPEASTADTDLQPVFIIQSDVIDSPGSVVVMTGERGQVDALICNNYAHTISRHALDKQRQHNDGVLLRQCLQIPDGIATSRKGEWIAISNHATHAILIFEGLSTLNASSMPVGILSNIDYPHGLRFSSDDRFVVVADAGSPYLNIYERDSHGWRGLRRPLASFRAMSDEDFQRRRINVEEGGMKGIDMDADMTVIVSTCDGQPLVFFDCAAIMKQALAGSGPKSLLARTLDPLVLWCLLGFWRIRANPGPLRPVGRLFRKVAGMMSRGH